MRRDFGVTERREGYQEWNEQLRMWEAVTGGNGRVASGFCLSAVSRAVWCDMVNQALRILSSTRNLEIEKVIMNEQGVIFEACQEMTFLPRARPDHRSKAYPIKYD